MCAAEICAARQFLDACMLRPSVCQSYTNRTRIGAILVQVNSTLNTINMGFYLIFYSQGDHKVSETFILKSEFTIELCQIAISLVAVRDTSG